MKLKKIDLRKNTDSSYPEIDTRSSYLVKIYGAWYAGKFTREWYGLNFNNWGATGIQMNHDITEVYRICSK